MKNIPNVGGQCALGCSIDVQTRTQASLRWLFCAEIPLDNDPIGRWFFDKIFNWIFVLQLRTSQKYREAKGA